MTLFHSSMWALTRLDPTYVINGITRFLDSVGDGLEWRAGLSVLFICRLLILSHVKSVESDLKGRIVELLTLVTHTTENIDVKDRAQMVWKRCSPAFMTCIHSIFDLWTGWNQECSQRF